MNEIVLKSVRWDVAPEYLEIPEIRDFSNYVPVRVLSSGRERVEHMRILRENGEAPLEVVVKTFPRLNGLKRAFSKRIGTKAQRAFRAAKILRERGVGTPAPVALAETFSARGEILESRLVTAFVPAMSNFRDELFCLYRDNPDCETLMNLFRQVAEACRAFHDCGIVHRDLGNQNIALKKRDDGTWSVFFIDLDRVHFYEELSDELRGKDLARLDLPSDLRRVFHCLYYLSYGPPWAFSEAELRERRAFERHTKLRPWRHPFREWKIRREWRRAAASGASFPMIPLGKELWIWDTRSEQAIPAYASRERRKFRPLSNIFKIAGTFILHGKALWENYKEKSAALLRVPVEFSQSFGVALEVDSKTWELQLNLLAELEEGLEEKFPVLLRAYHHKGEAHWREFVEKAQSLSARGNDVAVALVQDRAAIRDLKSWEKMLELVVAGTQGFVSFYEIGHATNRGKWGIWEFRDYESLLAPAIRLKEKFPKLRFTGPACIDFDLHTLAGMLSSVPAGTFFALSQHLYVDRRGAPENFQGKFDTLKKCAIHSAFAKTYGIENEKIIVSEVNWPLLGVGVYGPVDSPIVTPGPWETRPDAPWAGEPPRVSEEDYAKYLCRYWLLSIASGHVSRVYWWRLVHRGFGLVDDSDPQNPRRREAFFALKKLAQQLAGTRFERQIDGAPTGTWIFEFSRKDGSRFCLKWTRDSFPEIA